MPDTPVEMTRNKLARMYGIGILAFSAIVGSVSIVVAFIVHVNWS
jgi:hypothetical protein